MEGIPLRALLVLTFSAAPPAKLILTLILNYVIHACRGGALGVRPAPPQQHKNVVANDFGTLTFSSVRLRT